MKTLDIHEQILEKLAVKKDYPGENTFSTELRKISGSFDIAPPKKNELLVSYHNLVNKGRLAKNSMLETFLKKREIRTLSGVAPVAVLTKPYFCPGRCSFCPTEAKMPKSYLSNEPAVMRAVLNKWDPYKQVTTRLNSYERNGHDSSKCELIVIGGTWSFLPKRYQTWFIKRLFDGLNGYTAKSLAEAQKFNETAKHRAVGMCLETRPDYITVEEVTRMRKLGCTRVEIGLQTTNSKVLKLNKRGHGVETVRRATRLLRDAGFKISYHMMPNLPGSTPQGDIQDFYNLFHDEGLHPDMLKIYPCVVVKDAEIYDWWKQKKYIPYDQETLNTTLIECKKLVPEYVRITRTIRDIPTTSIYAGNMKANLRQDIMQLMKDQGTPCKCIRCREPRRTSAEVDDTNLVVREYQTQGGKELFISYESKDKKTIYGFVRVRLPQETHPQILKNLPDLKDAAIIRELHVYGPVIPIDSTDGLVQHKGFGKKLMAAAEKHAKDAGYIRMAVISGIGVREYYKKQLGYKLGETYMIKTL